MKKMLYNLFDFQKFSGNERHAKLIANTERRYGKALSDDELEGLSAAGAFLWNTISKTKSWRSICP